MLTVMFGESTMSRTCVQFWYNRFKEGQEDVNNDDRPDSLSTSTTDENIEAVKKMILNNHRITIREVANNVGICSSHVKQVFTHILRMKRVAAKFVPKLRNLKKNYDVAWTSLRRCFRHLTTIHICLKIHN